MAVAADLVERISLPNAGAIERGYDALGRLTSTALEAADHSVLDGHGYPEFDAAHRRMKQTRTRGTVSSTLDFTYDDRDQLTGSTAKEANGTVRTHETFGYGYDPAGNVANRTANQFGVALGVDARNQLTTATTSGTLTVGGSTEGGAIGVTVNGQAASLYADGAFARSGLGYTPGANTFTAVATAGSGAPETQTVSRWVPGSTTFQYDAHGNLTSDGRRTFAWDVENRLTSVTAAGQWRTEYEHDGLSRVRVRREKTWNGTTFVEVAVVRYVYDGRLVLEERDGNHAPLRTYTRGLDLSGTLSGAGGIGGLVALTRHDRGVAEHAWYHADGSGNVTALVNAAGQVVARYQYEPFGQLTGQSGSWSDANPLRFSSKESHPASGLYSYGFRFYDPGLMRWLNRDPIGEMGGPNLHAYLRNESVNRVDPDGLAGNPIMGLGGAWDVDPYGPGGPFFGPGLLYQSPVARRYNPLECLVYGVLAGAAGAAGTVAIAPALVAGLTAAGISSTAASAAVTGGLGVTGAIGAGLGMGYALDRGMNGDWNEAAFTLGTFAGGGLVGLGGGGRYLANNTGTRPTLIPLGANPFVAEIGMGYSPTYPGDSFLGWMASAPTPASGGLAATGSGVGIGLTIKLDR